MSFSFLFVVSEFKVDDWMQFFFKNLELGHKRSRIIMIDVLVMT